MADGPNVILLITHDTGRYLSPYGIPTVDTPNCERLAAESTLFENYFCTAPQCSPSRASIVTGRYPHANGTMGLCHADFAWALHPSERPAAMQFGPAGYQTWLLGGMHETKDARTLGFDEVDLHFNLPELPGRLTKRLAARNRHRPFYCQIGCFETHRPWRGGKGEIPPDDSQGIHIPGYLSDGPRTRQELAEFQGIVKHFDRQLGALMDLIDREGLRDDTILVITTDHGIAMPHAKGTMYDPGLETMLFLRWPGGKWPAGARRKELLSNVDLLPTLLEACGIEIPGNVQGHSFLGLLDGQPYHPRREIFGELTFHDVYDPQRCIRTEQYKYIRYLEKITQMCVPGDIADNGADLELERRYAGRPPVELFDLQKDLWEQENLAGQEAYREVEEDLKARLAAWMQETGDPLVKGPVASPFYYDVLRDLFG